eukprot:TRINITY_DN12832_c0_g1_i1.p1 TRINITY_DN12832_c0_g1~~TRINITY_DN12832_c0_g1_i1.p1  ORF type:complete len:296 (+),score=45.90 TRINITY_DN12832_c0_g1_i1:81-968(+)
MDPAYEINFAEVQQGSAVDEGHYSVVHQGVYRGHQVAVKLWKNQEMSRELLTLFGREVTNMSKLNHTNIVKYIGACTQPPHVCLIMEYIDGCTLFDLIHNKDFRYDWKLVIKLARDVAAGMAYLHTLSPVVMHRDLKSLNILVNREFQAKICDFGFSKATDIDVPNTGVRGTYQWMAPEVITSKKYDESSDVYSFGIMLWELVSRDVPYADVQGGTPMAVVSQLINKVVRRQERPTIPSHCPQPLAQLIRACWHAEPRQRPPFPLILRTLESPQFQQLPQALVPWVNCSYCAEQQ